MAKHPGIKPVSQDQRIRMMLFGWPGTGKTSLAATGGKGTLIIRSPVDHMPKRALNSGAEEWITSNWDEQWEALEYIRHEGNNWKWIWLDSISLWQDIGLDDIWEFTLDKNPNRKDYGLDKLEYGINMERLQQWVRVVSGVAKHSSFNLGITAHPAELWDPASEQTLLMPWIQGRNMSPKICGYMNLVAYMETRKKEGGNERYRVIRTETTESYFAKDQFDAFENNRLVNPTIPKIEELIHFSRGSSGRRTPGRRGQPKPRPGRRGRREQ